MSGTETKSKKQMTHEEWLTEGERLFGADIMKWQFVCPACGNIQTMKDFKALGADPQLVYQSCIGRHHKPMAKLVKGKQPCDWAAYGLLNFCPILVSRDDGEAVRVFGFNEAVQAVPL